MSAFTLAAVAAWPRLARVAAALVVGVVCGWLAQQLHMPLPWTIGPLLGCAALNIRGANLAALPAARHFGQWGIGTALGVYFTRDTLVDLSANLWPLAASLGFAVLLGFAFAWTLHRFAGVAPATAFFAGAIGGASEMAIQGERHGADVATIAAVHALRITIVVLVVPFAFLWLGLHGQDAYTPARAGVEPAGLALLVAATAGAAWLCRLTGAPNAWMIGPLLVTVVLTASGHLPSALPAWVILAAQLVIGIALGTRFAPGFFARAPRLMRVVALGTLAGLLIAAAFGAGVARLAGLPVATMVLATVPGGLTEMSLTAKLLKLGVPIVTSFQITRVLTMLLLLGNLYRGIARARGWPVDVNRPAASRRATHPDTEVDDD